MHKSTLEKAVNFYFKKKRRNGHYHRETPCRTGLMILIPNSADLRRLLGDMMLIVVINRKEHHDKPLCLTLRNASVSKHKLKKTPPKDTPMASVSITL